MTLTPISPLPSLGIALWLVDLNAPLSTADADDPERLLDEAERAKARRFHFERDTRRYRRSHTALRLVLAEATGVDPQAVTFVEGPHGKPRLRAPQAPHFNMSHSGDWALIGVCADAPIGVDIELARDLSDLMALAERNFSAREFETLQAVEPAQQLTAFLRCWTRKEACLKALGSGLSIEPHVFEAGIDTAQRSTAIALDAGSCRMEVVSLALPIPGMAACARLSDADHHLAL